MSDAADKSEAPADTPASGAGSPAAKTPAAPTTSTSPSPTAPNPGADDDGGGGEVKGDSEAETVVLPGKEDATTSPQRRAIKHEGNEDGKPSGKRVSDVPAEKPKPTPERDGESKAKKATKDHTATSSNLSSTRSSPSPGARAASRAGSESVQSKTKSHPDSDSVSRTSQSRKRKMASEDGEEKSHKRRQKRDGSLETAANGDRERREKTKSSNPRSESPQPRTRHRAQSLKGQASNATQKRGKPPPLFVGPRSKTNDDESSEGSASPHSAAPHRRRLVSAGDGSATSPAKMPHKKLRDKSGRTFLARACDSEDIEAVRTRLQERPEDLDTADYAGNTPLQIASLSGRHEIVKTLLDAGCKTDCRNVDQDTPLIDAVENGHLDVIKLLLDAGLNPRQTNAKGEELMDLLDAEADDYEEIKKLLTKARESRRRVSDDHQASHTGRESAAAQSPRESNMNSPPPLASASRRRTARGEATRNDLLWVNATRENLRNKARVGDDTAVNHILSMSPSVADVESVLAAARGSHELSLSLILAMGQPPANPDPDPIPGERTSQSTPMLGAIGRGNLRVIELLLEQPGFNPTRRLYQGKAYHDIARDRRGANWEEEYKLLKAAYDKAKGRSSTATSPSNSKKIKSEATGSPGQDRPRTKSDAKVALERKKSSTDARRPTSRSDPRTESPERSRPHGHKHLRIPSKPSSREQSIAVSDREASPLPKSGEKKSRRSLSDPEAPDVEVQKPRKRLISKRDLNEGDRQRRTSIASVGSASSQDHIRRLAREQSSQKAKRGEKREDVKKEESREETKSKKADSTKKRSHLETMSPDSNQREAASLDASKKAKRIRVDTEGRPKKRADGERSSRQKSPATGAVQITSSSSKDTKVSKASASSSRKVSPAAGSAADSGITKIKEEPDLSSSQLQKEAQDAADAEKEQKEQARKQAEKAKREREEEERVAREEAAARAAEQLRREEAERKLKAEQEEAARKAKAEKEEAERKAREEEEARLERKRQEEEQARKQAERERLRKEQEEMQARRRKEQEEKERLAREKKQQEEERRRRETLPPALRIAAELTSEQARKPSEVLHWLPLYTAESQQLDIPCDEGSKHERWISNLQAAPILGVTDLDLSQYTAWTKQPASDSHRFSLWRILRRKLARYQLPESGPPDHQEEFRLDAEAREKFDGLKSVFWIRLSDLQDIVPRHQHLHGIDLKCCAMAIRPAPNSANKTNGAAPTANGLPSMPNGYH